ncbi:hypothetical protein BO78DRAFT_431857 [Aspergillus sclerotiicarbonarius CBS 121057]|uniref:Myb-like DNA-binding domain-containing protein n=1 Tax=Aspergillus sclerotiicarbonarius (strain CBS 121057 / IBT 28362) TaxID=1448318 RepID=A0A319E163_ASPSB|nr:hypothetical protein BO78DRAFT_431857 [Aspergillus sclerotiicarbonarius CBS 121057]
MYAPNNSAYSMPNMPNTPDLSALHMTTPTTSPSTQTPPTTPRRSRAMPIDGPTVKFLYTIIKQLDLKSIDWSLVATELGISNGHAARMRYSRFKQQMEGIVPTPRPARVKKAPKKAAKASPTKAELAREPVSPHSATPPPQPPIKQEPDYLPYGLNPHVKPEDHTQTMPNLSDIPLAAPSPVESMSHITMMPNWGNIAIAAPPAGEGMAYYPMSFTPGEPCFYSPMNMVSGLLNEPRPLTWEPFKSEPVEEDGIPDKAIKEEQQEEVKVEPQEEVEEEVEEAEEAEEAAQVAAPEEAQQESNKVVLIDD